MSVPLVGSATSPAEVCAALVELPELNRRAAIKEAITRIAYLSAVDRDAYRTAFTRDHKLISAGAFDAAVREERTADSSTRGDDQGDSSGPAYRVPMSQGRWAYSTGTADFPRGVYRQPSSGEPWEQVAPLPVVLALIVRRAGDGKVRTTDYLVAATDEAASPRIVVNSDDLRTGAWAPRLINVVLSDDDRIIKATATAIRLVAKRDAEIREATPRVTDDGRFTVPVPETVPSGWLETSPMARGDALTMWGRDIAPLVARVPQSALLVGATLVSPYIGPLHYQSHIVHMSGNASQGKTTIMRTLAGLVGKSVGHGGTFRSWNLSGKGRIALGRLLGELAHLPAFMNESGMAPFNPTDWAELIYSVTEGGTRLVSARGGGLDLSTPWEGVLFSNGNGRMTAGLGAGRFAGVPRRVVELRAPFTEGADVAESIDLLVAETYGHPMVEVLHRYSVDDVAALIERTRAMLPDVDGNLPRAYAKHLRAHLAGAVMADKVFGSGSLILDAATSAALEYLDEHGHEQDHDADRVMAAIIEDAASRPAAWPTQADYRTTRMSNASMAVDGETFHRAAAETLPIHGVDRAVRGVRTSNGLAMFPVPFHSMCEELGLDEDAALTELHGRKTLLVAASERKSGKWVTNVMLDKSVKLYRFKVDEVLDAGNEDSDQGDQGDQVDQGDQGTATAPAATSAGSSASSTSTSPAPAATSAGSSASSTSTSSAPSSTTRPATVTAITVAGNVAWYSSEVSVPLPDSALTDLAALVAYLPEPGECVIMLDEAAAKAVGITNRKLKHNAVWHKAFAPLVDSGWHMEEHPGIRPRVLPWTGLQHKERPGTVRVVILPWLDAKDFPRNGDDEADGWPIAYARRVEMFAERAGVAFLGTPAKTGVRMLRDMLESTSRRQPRFVTAADGAPTPAGLSSWKRPLTDEERAGGFMHEYDAVRNYLPAYRQALVAVDDLRQSTGPVMFDPKRAGWWLVDLSAWTHPDVPSPANVATPGPTWVTTDVGKLYGELGHHLDVIDSWTNVGRQLAGFRGFSDRIRDVFAELVTVDDPNLIAVRTAVKGIYQRTHGKLNSDTRVIHRPDWYAAIRDNAWTGILRKMYREAGILPGNGNGTGSGRTPIQVDIDALTYWSLNEDPMIGRPTTLSIVPPGSPAGSEKLGQFKWKGTKTVAEYLGGRDA